MCSIEEPTPQEYVANETMKNNRVTGPEKFLLKYIAGAEI